MSINDKDCKVCDCCQWHCRTSLNKFHVLILFFKTKTKKSKRNMNKIPNDVANSSVFFFNFWQEVPFNKRCVTGVNSGFLYFSKIQSLHNTSTRMHSIQIIALFDDISNRERHSYMRCYCVYRYLNFVMLTGCFMSLFFFKICLFQRTWKQ